jgi:aminopeptidase-like protein
MSEPANSHNIGQEIYNLAQQLFPIHRSLTGEGVRHTLDSLRSLVPGLLTVEVPSGTRAFDWLVPSEWNIRAAYITDETGRRIVDFAKNNLHVLAYSMPVDKIVSLSELNEHLYSLPDQPDAIPFVMSYYSPRWGFSLAENVRRNLRPGQYHVFIDSSLQPGSLSYGELILPGREQREVLLSTYICHPSMANDNVSGLSVTAYLAKWLLKKKDRRYTYRILFAPETIGAIVYLSRHLQEMRTRTVAGFVVTCVGDEGEFSFVPSRKGATLADRVALHVLGHQTPRFRQYTFLDRGSDERQFCSPGIDLPVVSIMKSKYREYPQYHTSFDNMSLISSEGLNESFELLRNCLSALENNYYFRATCQCEPQLGKRDLYPSVSIKGSVTPVMDLMNILAYCDGDHDLIDVAEQIGRPIASCSLLAEKLFAHGLLERLLAPKDESFT